MFRHGCTTINFNWILIRQRWFSSLLNTTRKACLSLSLSIWMELRFIFLHLSATWVLPLTRISLFSNTSPAPVKSAIFNCVESIPSVTNSHKMLWRHRFLLLSCPELITAIPYSLAVLSSSFTNFKKVQNNAARLIYRTPKFDHISPVLHTLHWFPVEQRIEYKLLLLAFKSVNNDGLSYLSDLLQFYIASRQLRSSSDTRLLCIPSFRLKSFGQHKFSYQASVLWNSLPISLCHSNSTSAFKSALKTHLFPSQ